jgi:hypothetical protein
MDGDQAKLLDSMRAKENLKYGGYMTIISELSEEYRGSTDTLNAKKSYEIKKTGNRFGTYDQRDSPLTDESKVSSFSSKFSLSKNSNSKTNTSVQESDPEEEE